MSRSERNRAARNAQGTRPVSSVPIPAQVRPSVMADRVVTSGYTGISSTKRNRVRYSGSQTGGYSSQWSLNPLYVCPIERDMRWSA